MDFTECLARSRSGDDEAAADLFDRWRPLLRLQARTLLGGEISRRVEPSDVVQEALTQAAQDLTSFRGNTEAEWLAWLKTLVAGHAAKARRRHLADKRDARRERHEWQQPAASGAASPLAAAIEREEARRLAAAIEQLPEQMQEIVVSRVFDQQPFEEIARELECTPGAARVAWTRAIRRLRAALDEDQ